MFVKYSNRVVKKTKELPVEFQACAYYTDGGVDTNSNYYFLQNVWKLTSICYCTVSYSNVHVQSILKTVEIPPTKNNPMEFLLDKKDKLKIRVPYEKFMPDDRDGFQLIKSFQVHLRSGGYNAYAKSFVVFYSEIEIKNSKFVAMTKRFLNAKTYADTKKMKLGIVCHQDDTKLGIEVVEFDVSNKHNIERGLKTKNPGVYPLLWVNITQKYLNETFNYDLKQNIAAKYVSLKLLTSSNPNSYSNIDLYNLGLKTVAIDL